MRRRRQKTFAGKCSETAIGVCFWYLLTVLVVRKSVAAAGVVVMAFVDILAVLVPILDLILVPVVFHVLRLVPADGSLKDLPQQGPPPQLSRQ